MQGICIDIKPKKYGSLEYLEIKKPALYGQAEKLLYPSNQPQTNRPRAYTCRDRVCGRR